MLNSNKNASIKCSIKDCTNHCQSENYCSLDVISVASHESCPSAPECTDCMSFVKKAGK